MDILLVLSLVEFDKKSEIETFDIGRDAMETKAQYFFPQKKVIETPNIFINWPMMASDPITLAKFLLIERQLVIVIVVVFFMFWTLVHVTNTHVYELRIRQTLLWRQHGSQWSFFKFFF